MSYFDEIFSKFAAAKERKLCRIITSKALEGFIGVMEATKNSVGSLDFAAEL